MSVGPHVGRSLELVRNRKCGHRRPKAELTKIKGSLSLSFATHQVAKLYNNIKNAVEHFEDGRSTAMQKRP